MFFDNYYRAFANFPQPKSQDSSLPVCITPTQTSLVSKAAFALGCVGGGVKKKRLLYPNRHNIKYYFTTIIYYYRYVNNKVKVNKYQDNRLSHTELTDQCQLDILVRMSSTECDFTLTHKGIILTVTTTILTPSNIYRIPLFLLLPLV